jgi:hypothetical protein
LTELQDRLSATLVDRYVLERELGRGGMATVYLLRDGLALLKVLHQGTGSDARPRAHELSCQSVDCDHPILTRRGRNPT